MAPLDMYKEVNTGTNLPAQIEIYATDGDAYKFLFMAKGGGSANKSYLYPGDQGAPEPESLLAFLDAKLRTLGTAACPPYHLAIVIGGTSAEYTLKVAKLASARYLDTLPTEGNELGRGFRDVELEAARCCELAQTTGIGAQFGGKYFCHDVRVDPAAAPRRLVPGRRSPCRARPIARRSARSRATASSSSSSRPIPRSTCPTPRTTSSSGEVVKIDLDRPMSEIRATLSQLPDQDAAVADRADDRRARHRAREDQGAPRPRRGDAAVPASDSLRLLRRARRRRPRATRRARSARRPRGAWTPTSTSSRRTAAACVMLAKGNRSPAVTDACKKHGGFYLGSIGGPAARLAKDCIKKVEVLEYPELGMEAVWKIDVVDFPAFIVVDDKGNDFFAGMTGGAGDGKTRLAVRPRLSRWRCAPGPPTAGSRRGSRRR